MANNTNEQKIIDLRKISKRLWEKKKTFYKVWVVTFILSCIWIFPQPRYYTCEVALAPEMSGEDMGGLSSIASSFGFNIGGMSGQDAIYPELYPELFNSPEFVVGLKKNWLMRPFIWIKSRISNLVSPKEPASKNIADINPTMMNYNDFILMQIIMKKISCSVDKKTSVITISVKDQDPLVCTLMADSVKAHLQDFIIRYRTSKAKEDVAHYQQMRDSAEVEYNKAMERYSDFCDSHKDAILQVYQSERDKLESDLSMKQNTLTAMETQLQATKVKLQEKTPAFTTLKSAIVPIKPAGPKRMIFVAMMLVLSSIVLSVWLTRKEIF